MNKNIRVYIKQLEEDKMGDQLTMSEAERFRKKEKAGLRQTQLTDRVYGRSTRP